MELKILTYNIWDLHAGINKDRQQRFERIISKILELDADIVCLQESWDPKHRLELREQLTPKYYTTISPGKIKTRHVFWKKFDTTGGLVIFSKFPIKSWHFTPFTRWAHASIIEFCATKGFLTAKLDTPTGSLEIANTHLNTLGILGSGLLINKKQFKEAILGSNSGSDGIPLIIAGDFNKDKMLSDPFYAQIISANGLQEPASLNGNGIIPTHRPENIYAGTLFHPAKKPLQFDYFFIKNVDNLENIRVEPLYFDPPLSDHDPLLLTVSLGGK